MDHHDSQIDVHIRKVRRSTTDNSKQWAFIPKQALHQKVDSTGVKPMHEPLPEGTCWDPFWHKYWADYPVAKYSKEALNRISQWP